MKYSTRTLLLSAFLFPGAGHLYVKKYLTGSILISVTLWAIYYLLASSLAIALRVSDMIQRGEVGADLASISLALSQQASTANSRLVDIATIALAGCYLIGVIDGYRVGRARDNRSDQNASAE
jgi:TM2 domain-containing membrane protein YozV